ncbi:hypothetical protein Q2379_26175, partial [Escherichia coli]|nr:hypothetical protein [Escherichia coli]
AQKLDGAGQKGEIINADVEQLEEAVANMKTNTDGVNKNIWEINWNSVEEYNSLVVYIWILLGGVSKTILVKFCVLGW